MMKKIFNHSLFSGGCFLIALFFLTASIYSAPKKTVTAIVVNFTGKLSVKPFGETQFSSAKKGQFLYEGDIVRTEKNSMAAITFVSGVQVKINANTEFTINVKQLGKADEEVTMNRGQVFSKVMRRGSRFGIRTPVALAAVRGTEFDVNVEPPRKKVIKVKIRKSELLIKGLAEVKKSLKESYEKEAKEKLKAREAELKVALEKKQAEEAGKKAEESKKAAEEAAKKAEQEKKDAIKEGTIEQVKIAEEAEKKAVEFKKAAEEAAQKAAEEKQQQEMAEASKKLSEESAMKAELEKQEKAEEVKRAEAEIKKASASKEETEQEVEALVQEQRVSVLEGVVELGNDFGKQFVSAGQYANVTTGQSPEPPQPMKEEEKPTWQDQVKVTEKEQQDVAEKLQGSTTSAVTTPVPGPEDKILKMEVETPLGKKTLNLKFKKEK